MSIVDSFDSMYEQCAEEDRQRQLRWEEDRRAEEEYYQQLMEEDYYQQERDYFIELEIEYDRKSIYEKSYFELIDDLINEGLYWRQEHFLNWLYTIQESNISLEEKDKQYLSSFGHKY